MNSLALEEYVEFFRRESGIGVTVLRFSNVYGPGAEPRRGQGVIAAWVRALALGQRVQLIGSEEAERDFVYVADAADAVERVLGAEPGPSTWAAAGPFRSRPSSSTCGRGRGSTRSSTASRRAGSTFPPPTST